MYLFRGETLLSLVLVLVRLATCGEGHRETREVRCPIYMDPVWKVWDNQCDEGKAYHCFEDENSHVVNHGCYEPKLCMTGAHPVVEGTVTCAFCQTGFQPVDQLNSAKYVWSYCKDHAPECNPEYGQSECTAPTRENDRACTCNATLGFSPDTNSSECQCFTPNSPCSGCEFIGCPAGWVRNERGFCEPEKATTLGEVPTSSPEHTTIPARQEDGLPPGVTTAIVLVLLVGLVGLVIGLVCCYRRNLLPCKREASDEEERVPVPRTQAEEPRPMITNIGKAHAVYIVASEHGGVTPTISEGNPSNGRLENGSPGSHRVPASRSIRSQDETSTSNGPVPSESDEIPGESVDPVSPEDTVPADKLPREAESEESPPLLPTAPDLPLDPSAPPASLPLVQDPLEEEGEDLDETHLKTPLSAATSEETEVKVPLRQSVLSDETEPKRPVSLDDEQTDLKSKTLIPAGDSGDTAQVESTDATTPLLGNDSPRKGDDVSSKGKKRWVRDKDLKPQANITQALGTDDADADVSIHKSRKVFPIPV